MANKKLKNLFVLLFFLFVTLACGQGGTYTPVPNTRSSIRITSRPTNIAFQTPTSVPKGTREAVTPGADSQVHVIYSSINVREGPGLEYESTAYLFENDIVLVIDYNSNDTWYKVRLEDGVEGWVAASVVSFVEASSGSAFTNGVMGTPNATTNQLQVIVSSVNFRTGPGTNYPILANLYLGDTVTAFAVSSNGAWYNVRTGDGTDGWIATSVVQAYEGNSLRSIPVAVTIPPLLDNDTEDNQVCRNATAICGDGTCSYSSNRRGTCSHHGGVAVWLK